MTEQVTATLKSKPVAASFGWCYGVMLRCIVMCTSKRGKKKVMSEVGFEPTPTRVDCDLNAAP